MKIAPSGVEQWMNEYETRSIEGTDRLRSAVAALYERQGTGNVLIAQEGYLRIGYAPNPGVLVAGLPLLSDYLHSR